MKNRKLITFPVSTMLQQQKCSANYYLLSKVILGFYYSTYTLSIIIAHDKVKLKIGNISSVVLSHKHHTIMVHY